MKQILVASVMAVSLAACNRIPFLNSSPTPSPSPENINQVGTDSGSLGSAVQAGQPMKCNIAKDDGSSAITYLNKGQKVKVTGMSYQGSDPGGNMVSDGSYIYLWSDGQKDGMKMKMPSAEQLKDAPDVIKDQIPDFSKADIQEEYQNQGYKINCQPQTVADSEFVPPTTVNFRDMTAFTDQIIKMMPKSNDQ